MKIITEKINSKPPHSVSKKDIQVVLKHIPKEWVGVATNFKISAQLFTKFTWDRPVIQNNVTYNILSRGFEKSFIIRELLIEMAVWPLHITTYGHHLNAAQRKKAEEFIQPYYEKIMTELEANSSDVES